MSTENLLLDQLDASEMARRKLEADLKEMTESQQRCWKQWIPPAHGGGDGRASEGGNGMIIASVEEVPELMAPDFAVVTLRNGIVLHIGDSGINAFRDSDAQKRGEPFGGVSFIFDRETTVSFNNCSFNTL